MYTAATSNEGVADVCMPLSRTSDIFVGLRIIIFWSELLFGTCASNETKDK
jgi:hypothetical protein